MTVEFEPNSKPKIKLPPKIKIIDGMIKFLISHFSLKKSYKNNIPNAVAPNSAITDVFAHKTSNIEYITGCFNLSLNIIVSRNNKNIPIE